jgi:hypothetical protein
MRLVRADRVLGGDPGLKPRAESLNPFLLRHPALWRTGRDRIREMSWEKAALCSFRIRGKNAVEDEDYDDDENEEERFGEERTFGDHQEEESLTS